MNFAILKMLYNIPELQDLIYQLYRQMPERVSREEQLQQVWAECGTFTDPKLHDLFNRLEDAENCAGELQGQAAFFAGIYLAWQLFQSLGQA
mgnify:CR=1 FL=1